MSRLAHVREYLSPPAAGAITGSRPETVIAWIRSGELPAVNFARRGASRPRYRIHRDELAAFLRRRTVSPPTKPAPRRLPEATVTRYV